MRRAAKRDASEVAIVDALRQAGYWVYRMIQPCDLLVYRSGRWWVLEVKLPGARPRKDQEAQQEFLRLTGTPIVRTPEEALRAVGAIR
jgi:hypothetical protein